MIDHERIEELLAAQALGGLDAADAASLASARAEHEPGCEECARLERGFTEVAAGLAMELEAVPMRAGFEEQVMAAARASAPTPVVTVPPATEPSPWLRRLGALAAAAALVLGGWALRVATEGPEGPSPAFLAQATILHLQGDAEGSVSVAYRPGTAQGYVLGTGVPSAGEDRVYEVWLITGETPVSVGCFTPQDGELVGRLDQQVDAADIVAVTVETPACPAAPTTAPILTAEVATA